MCEIKTQQWDIWRLQDVLRTHPRLRVKPCPEPHGLHIEGEVQFDARPDGAGAIEDTYTVAIFVPANFPQSIPVVRELGGRVPKDYHTNPDGTLCLGSDVRLHLELNDEPTLTGFINRCIIPFLAGCSHLDRTGEELIPGLAHGDDGLRDDYMSLLRVSSFSACVQMMALMSLRKRVANKQPCSCGSGRRVGRCHHLILNTLRERLGRSWWRQEHARWLAKAPRQPGFFAR